MSQREEIARLVAVKAQLVATTRTVGWQYIRRIATNVVEKHIQEALDATDKEQGEMLRIKAKAMQQGLNDLFSAIEAGKSFDEKQFQDDSGLGELEGAYGTE